MATQNTYLRAKARPTVGRHLWRQRIHTNALKHVLP